MAPDLPEPYTNLTASTKEAVCQTQSGIQPLYCHPRSCIKRCLGISSDTPLPVPSFKPKSKMPKLDYGGLQPPSLHCFATSLFSESPSTPPQETIFLKPTPKSLPFPTSFRKTLTHVQSTSNNFFFASERTRFQLREIFYEITKAGSSQLEFPLL